jgi:hypothetical protein
METDPYIILLRIGTGSTRADTWVCPYGLRIDAGRHGSLPLHLGLSFRVGMETDPYEGIGNANRKGRQISLPFDLLSDHFFQFF